jgi:hypothetical protein
MDQSSGYLHDLMVEAVLEKRWYTSILRYGTSHAYHMIFALRSLRCNDSMNHISNE